ncbi:Fic family protein [Burkholderia sp. MR1-5-21]
MPRTKRCTEYKQPFAEYSGPKGQCVFSPQTHQLGDAHLDRPGQASALVSPALWEDVSKISSWGSACPRHLQRPEPLVRAACAAFGFACLHPFRDGNGRIHRFLDTRGRFISPGRTNQFCRRCLENSQPHKLSRRCLHIQLGTGLSPPPREMSPELVTRPCPIAARRPDSRGADPSAGRR